MLAGAKAGRMRALHLELSSTRWPSDHAVGTIPEHDAAALGRTRRRLARQLLARLRGACRSAHVLRHMHKMLVAQLPQPGAGQGISMDKLGNPVQVGTTILKYTFDLTLVEVVAEAVQDRSWSVRVLAPLMPGGPMPIASRVTEGPVFHHANGAIGCIATPLTFTLEANAPYHGVKADRAQVKHAYFILDTGGVWSGMGRTKTRTSEMAIYNRVSCVKHANKLRARGAVFTAQQNAVLDAMTLALVQTMADVESEEEDEAGVEDEMMSPGRAAHQA